MVYYGLVGVELHDFVPTVVTNASATHEHSLQNTLTNQPINTKEKYTGELKTLPHWLEDWPQVYL